MFLGLISPLLNLWAQLELVGTSNGTWTFINMCLISNEILIREFTQSQNTQLVSIVANTVQREVEPTENSVRVKLSPHFSTDFAFETESV